MKNNIQKKTLREFGLLIGLVIPFLIGWVLPILGGHPFRLWTIGVGIPLLIIAMLRPLLLLYPYRAWMKLGFVLGWVNSRIILGLVFLIVLQPIALILRVLGHDPLRIKKTGQKSYREFRANHKINLKKIF